jgi:hypothetical protein
VAIAVSRTCREKQAVPQLRSAARKPRTNALAGLRLIQLRESRREWNRVIDAGMAGALAVIRDRLLAIPDRLATLTPDQRGALRREVTEPLEAWSPAEV